MTRQPPTDEAPDGTRIRRLAGAHICGRFTFVPRTDPIPRCASTPAYEVWLRVHEHEDPGDLVTVGEFLCGPCTAYVRTHEHVVKVRDYNENSPHIRNLLDSP